MSYHERLGRHIRARGNRWAMWLPRSFKMSGWSEDVTDGRWLEDGAMP